MKKLTVKKYEGSVADKRADAAGKHGKEGSKKDMAADRAAVKKANAKRK